jgi:hypothetical protein
MLCESGDRQARRGPLVSAAQVISLRDVLRPRLSSTLASPRVVAAEAFSAGE